MAILRLLSNMNAYNEKKKNRTIPKLVCYTAVFSVVTQRSSLRDDSKNGCEADYSQTS